jgi:hypothetical protein
MSFNEKLRDVKRCFEGICAAHGFNARRIDETLSEERINSCGHRQSWPPKILADNPGEPAPLTPSLV